VDKLTLAALEATLTGPPVPVLTALQTPVTVLGSRAERLAERLRADGVDARAVASLAAVGGGGAPGVCLPSAALSLPVAFAAPLRSGRPPVVGRVEDGRCLLDLRTVPPDEDETVVVAVLAAAPQPGFSVARRAGEADPGH
jgi:L-seryl-tRNA(Ser) seleniumtransferase